jgi:cellulose synthase/poly-beta-1,6-N-acetylglucosamine synthase-like glycosyltransferase
MNPYSIITATQWFFLLYFIVVNIGYIMLNVISIAAIYRYMQREALSGVAKSFSRLEPPVSILVPAYNEESTIATSVRSMLQINYPEFEIIVINDGSKDGTLDTLKREFALAPWPGISRKRLDSNPVLGMYMSPLFPNLFVLDKENGGKADSLNAGINVSRFPLYCSVDADSILQRDSLVKIVQPFLENPDTIASGGTVRAANGCEVEGGYLKESGLPKNHLALFQIVEYLRAYLIGRLGWSQMNALMVISGAFGLFRKEAVISAGGYRTDTLGEDMELVVRLHKTMRRMKKKYSITFVPDPICWTEVPEDLRTLRNQRVRWQRGLAESLWLNRDVLFNRHGGAVGWIAFPFMVAFELLGSFVEVFGYIFTFAGFFMGVMSAGAFFAFMFVAIGMGILLSVNSLLIEELSFHIYKKPGNTALLFMFAVAENFGYRQLNSWWRVVGLYRWARGKKGNWGEMKRAADWQKK